jgi:SNF2 family DNA or RNA helicase
MSPYIYQITKEDAGLNLPVKLYDRQYYQLTRSQRELYQQAKEEILLSVPTEELDSYVIFKLFNVLQQIVSGFWKRDDGQVIEIEHNRLRQLLDSITGLPEGEKMVIWCKFVRSVEQIAFVLREQYGQDSVALFYGALNEQERGHELERFRADARFLVATMATGGHGLDLTCAAYEIFYENSFKYAERIQAEDRVHRIGQTRRPTYVDLYARCGIEQRIETALARKEDVAKAFRREVNKLKAMELKSIVEKV